MTLIYYRVRLKVGVCVVFFFCNLWFQAFSTLPLFFFFSCSWLQNVLCPNMGWEEQGSEYWQSGINTHTHTHTCGSGLMLSSGTRIGSQTQSDVCLPCCVVLGANKDKQNNQSKQVMRRRLPGSISHQQDGGVPSGDGVPAARRDQRQRFLMFCSDDSQKCLNC